MQPGWQDRGGMGWDQTVPYCTSLVDIGRDRRFVPILTRDLVAHDSCATD